MSKVLTVIIRDEFPVRLLNEPCTYRTVHLPLTPEQMALIAVGNDEAISHCFIEAGKE
jgi:hypothetical protein